MKKITILGTSLSKNSINIQLAKYAAQQLPHYDISFLGLSAESCPMYNIDTEKEDGFPFDLDHWMNTIKNSDAIICSTSEHNANITAAFKNVTDWASRKQIDYMKDKPILLLSTSPGGYGGQNARNNAEKAFSIFGGKVISKFSLPKFQVNFKDGAIIEESMQQELLAAIQVFDNYLNDKI